MKQKLLRIFHPPCAGMLSALVVCSMMFTGPAHSDGGLGTLQDLLPPREEQSSKRAFDGRIRLFDHFLFYPMPVWSLVANGPAPAERSQFQRSRHKNAFRLDVVPKDEKFDDWNSRFSIIAFDNQNHPITTQATRLANYFRSECSPSNLRVFPGNRTQTKMVMVAACGNYSRKKDKGEMAAAIILKQGDINVTVMRQWRGPNFQARIRSQWPVSKSEIDGVLNELVRSKLVPAGS